MRARRHGATYPNTLSLRITLISTHRHRPWREHQAINTGLWDSNKIEHAVRLVAGEVVAGSAETTRFILCAGNGGG